VRGPNRDLGVRYEPTSPDLFRTIMGVLALEPRGSTFVDYGAGKGPTLVLAAEHGLSRLVGVEFSPELCDAPARNRERFAESRPETAGAAFEFVCVDAGRYEPPAGPAVLYCYNPFGEPVRRAALDRIEESFRATRATSSSSTSTRSGGASSTARRRSSGTRAPSGGRTGSLSTGRFREPRPPDGRSGRRPPRA
jgi:hypothetical protein